MTTADRQHVETCARQLREARRASGLSLRELARRAGTSHATLLAYEQGKKVPAMTTWWRILEQAGFAVELVPERRIRVQDGIRRDEELQAALKLAAQFPARHARHLQAPRFLAKFSR